MGILSKSKGAGETVISYEPLWKTMEKKKVTTYTLRYKGQISGATVQRLQRGESVSTNTIDSICKLLNCRVEDVIIYIEDDPN